MMVFAVDAFPGHDLGDIRLANVQLSSDIAVSKLLFVACFLVSGMVHAVTDNTALPYYPSSILIILVLASLPASRSFRELEVYGANGHT